MKHTKKILSLALALILLLGIVPTAAYAADSNELFGYLSLEATPYVGGMAESNNQMIANVINLCYNIKA